MLHVKLLTDPDLLPLHILASRARPDGADHKGHWDIAQGQKPTQQVWSGGYGSAFLTMTISRGVAAVHGPPVTQRGHPVLSKAHHTKPKALTCAECRAQAGNCANYLMGMCFFELCNNPRRWRLVSSYFYRQDICNSGCPTHSPKSNHNARGSSPGSGLHSSALTQ